MKITQELQKEGQEFYQNLITKAWEDNNFKEYLVKSPEAAIENFTGKKMVLPEGNVIIVEDQSDTEKIYLNIPRKPSYDEFELTDEQLELVAGGEIALAAFGIGFAVGALISGVVIAYSFRCQ